MAILVLVRHGRSSANTAGVLAGRSPDIHLDEVGREQARTVAARLAEVKVTELVSSPLERCCETAAPLAASLGLEVATDEDLLEVGYGAWQGRAISELVSEPLWRTVQVHPSHATFPDGENMAEMAARAVHAVRRRDRAVEEAHGAGAIWVAVSHGDVIKAVLADALGTPFDLFQRVHVDPGSVSVVRYGSWRPTVLAMNTHAGDLGWLASHAAQAAEVATGTVGGGSGPSAPHA